MDQSQVSGIVHRGQKLQRGMERGETVPEVDGVPVAERQVRGGRANREITGADRRVVGQRIGWNLQGRAGTCISAVLDGDHRVQRIVGAAQEDKQQFLRFPVGAGHTDGSFGQRPFDDEWDVNQRGESDA